MTPAVALVVLGALCFVMAVAGFRIAMLRKHDWAAGVTVILVSSAIGLSIQREWGSALAIALLLGGAYLAFKTFYSEPTPSRASFACALGNAGLFLMITTRDVKLQVLAAVLALGGPIAARWLTERSSRTVGLLLIFSGVALQWSRIAYVFDGWPYAR